MDWDEESVDLLWKLEDAFEIVFNPPDLIPIVTVGDLYRLILVKIGLPESERSLSDPLLHRVQTIFIEEYGASAHSVSPSVPLDRLIPPATRRVEWPRLGERLGCRLPDLRGPFWGEAVQALLGLVIILSIIPAAITLARSASHLIPALSLAEFVQTVTASTSIQVFCGGMLGSHLAQKLSDASMMLLPPGCSTVEGLVKELLKLNYGSLARQAQSVHRREAWEVLRALLAEHASLEADQITEESPWRNPRSPSTSEAVAPPVHRDFRLTR
ncbi:MAG: hypothetical protein KY468_16975 [Armatimonadetes bacterium]|nr:hypothetical protein [Armatimonadota bacterium]